MAAQKVEPICRKQGSIIHVQLDVSQPLGFRLAYPGDKLDPRRETKEDREKNVDYFSTCNSSCKEFEYGESCENLNEINFQPRNCPFFGEDGNRYLSRVSEPGSQEAGLRVAMVCKICFCSLILFYGFFCFNALVQKLPFFHGVQIACCQYYLHPVTGLSSS
jgi:hypothetical protein